MKGSIPVKVIEQTLFPMHRIKLIGNLLWRKCKKSFELSFQIQTYPTRIIIPNGLLTDRSAMDSFLRLLIKYYVGVKLMSCMMLQEN
jgi:hypothetical protein